jgi:hypothetical protein
LGETAHRELAQGRLSLRYHRKPLQNKYLSTALSIPRVFAVISGAGLALE